MKLHAKRVQRLKLLTGTPVGLDGDRLLIVQTLNEPRPGQVRAGLYYHHVEPTEEVFCLYVRDELAQELDQNRGQWLGRHCSIKIRLTQQTKSGVLEHLSVSKVQTPLVHPLEHYSQAWKKRHFSHADRVAFFDAVRALSATASKPMTYLSQPAGDTR